MKKFFSYSILLLVGILMGVCCGKKTTNNDAPEINVAIPEGLEWVQGDWTVGYVHIRIKGDQVFRSEGYLGDDYLEKKNEIKKLLDETKLEPVTLRDSNEGFDDIVKGLKLNGPEDLVCDEYVTYVIDQTHKKIYLHEGRNDDSFDGWEWDEFHRVGDNDAQNSVNNNDSDIDAKIIKVLQAIYPNSLDSEMEWHATDRFSEYASKECDTDPVYQTQDAYAHGILPEPKFIKVVVPGIDNTYKVEWQVKYNEIVKHEVILVLVKENGEWKLDNIWNGERLLFDYSKPPVPWYDDLG